MIEFGKFFPVPRRMASGTSKLLTILSYGLHAFLELVSMWVLMALRAREIVEAIHGIGFERRFHCRGILVAFDTRDCDVSPCQYKPSLLMSSQ